MLTLEICTTFLLLAYCILIMYYRKTWREIPVSQSGIETSQSGLGTAQSSPVSVSVIIPARNEEAAIGDCLDALLAQDYPKGLIELIVVDDHSSDNTARLAASKGATVVDLSALDGSEPVFSFKKKAIGAGIARARGELIVCTDADCTAGTRWIASLAAGFRQSKNTMMAGPVRISENGSALAVFQVLDFISLQGITGAAVYKALYPMANGANLAYSRNAFDEVGGFSGIDHIASGDDMLLMKKMQDRFPRRQAYIKNPDAIVTTLPSENLQAFFRQRIRWAGKTTHYGHVPTVITLALVYGLNLTLLILFASCFFLGGWLWLIVLLLVKTVVEMSFVLPVACFFDQQHLMKYFPLCQPFHILYTVLAGTFGSLGKVSWKGRVVR